MIQLDIHHPRSVVGCLRAVWNWMPDHVGHMVRRTRVAALLCALAAGGLYPLLPDLFVQAPQALPQDEWHAVQHFLGLVLPVVLYLLLLGLCYGYFIACWQSALDGTTRRHTFLRSMQYYALLAGCGVLGLAVLLAATWWVGRGQAASGVPVEVLLHRIGVAYGVLAVLMAVLLPAVHFAGVCHLSDTASKMRSIVSVHLKRGMRHLPYLLFMNFLSGLLLMAVMLPALLPLALLTMCSGVNAYGIMSWGDADALPSYFAVLQGISAGMAMLVWVYAAGWYYMNNLYAFGALESRAAATRKTLWNDALAKPDEQSAAGKS